MAPRVLAVVVLAGLAGAGVGVLARRAGPRASARPPRVEQALRALDGWQRGGGAEPLRVAARTLGDDAGLASPWAEEAELVRVAARGDFDALFRFAVEGPPAPARARALVLLVARGPDEPARARALARLRADYPASWAARHPEALR